MNKRTTPAATRRQALGALAALTAAATAACGHSRPGPAPAAPIHAPAPDAKEPFTPVAGDGKALLMQILAHPDDDLYFMNPDAQQMLDAGVPVVCVYLTAGESIGLNRVPGRPLPPPDRAAYSASRHQGLRQAYAQLLGVDRFTRWQRSVLELPGGVRAETNVLGSGERTVRLVFLNIAMLSDGARLPALWDVPGTVMRTVVATGSPLGAVGTYDHTAVVDTLVRLLDRYRPTVVHTLDPDPDFQPHDAAHPRDNDQPGCSDHRDHTPTALFTWKALARWVTDSTRRDGHAPRFVTTAFRGYYNQRWPHNLPPAVLARKARPVEAYGGSPEWKCGEPAGCGDYSQGGTHALTSRKGWIRSTHHRYPGALPVPATGTDSGGGDGDRLVAYGVLGTQAVRWRETAAGSGRFGTPDPLGGGPLASALCAVRDTAGRQLLLALRFAALEGQGGANTREIVVLEQRVPGGPFRPWAGLGTPDSTPEAGRRTGCPAAVATPDGRVHLFARTADRGVATRVREPNSDWSPWQRLGGGPVQDGLTAVLDGRHRVHVFAAGEDTVHHWAQDRPGGPVLVQPATGLPGPAEQPGAAPAPDGSLALVYRGPAAAAPTLRTPDGRTATELSRFTGYGPVTAYTVPAPGSGRPELLLLGRGDDGAIQVQYGTGAGARPLHAPGRLIPVGTPALLPGDERRLCVLGMSAGAAPWTWRPHPTSRA